MNMNYYLKIKEQQIEIRENLLNQLIGNEKGNICKLSDFKKCVLPNKKFYEFILILQDIGVFNFLSLPKEEYIYKGWFRVLKTECLRANTDISKSEIIIVLDNGIRGLIRLLKEFNYVD